MNTIKNEIKTWGVYLSALFMLTCLHEIGHCIPAWLSGFSAIPTPAKAYTPDQIPANIDNNIALGGMVSTIFFTITIITWFIKTNHKQAAAMLAAAIAMPALYTFRFMIQGRGHDDTEFQRAQAALGFDFNGHLADWVMLSLFLLGTLVWMAKCRPTLKAIPRLLIGILVTFIFIVALQKVNNTLFDPVFS